MRLCKRTCSPGPCHEYKQAVYEILWYQFIWGTAQVESELYKHRSALRVARCLVSDMIDLILYAPSTIFQLNRDGSSWVEPVLS